jgi:hypothetical protein
MFAVIFIAKIQVPRLVCHGVEASMFVDCAMIAP